MSEAIFRLCGGVLNFIGSVFGITYADACVYVCGYVCPALNILLGGLILWYAVRQARVSFGTWRGWVAMAAGAVSAIYVIWNIWTFIGQLRLFDYLKWKSQDIFNLIRHQLELGASANGWSFATQSVVVYVVPICCVALFGLILSQLLSRK